MHKYIHETIILYIARFQKSWSVSFIGVLFFVLLLLLVKFFLLLGKNDPIVLVIVLVSALVEQFLEHVSHLRVVRALVESQVPASAQILGELSWVALAQNFDRCGQFLFFDALVLVPLVVGLKPLPWQHSSQEIHANVTNALHVISACYD